MIKERNGWISVEDAMPPFDIPVFILLNTLDMLKGFFDAKLTSSF